jgi:hypothetical protein
VARDIPQDVRRLEAQRLAGKMFPLGHLAHRMVAYLDGTPSVPPLRDGASHASRPPNGVVRGLTRRLRSQRRGALLFWPARPEHAATTTGWKLIRCCAEARQTAGVPNCKSTRRKLLEGYQVLPGVRGVLGFGDTRE